MVKEHKEKREVVRIGGKLKEIITVLDEKGKILHKVISPLRVEVNPSDILQVIIGATILSIPVGYTEETWRLGESLPFLNVIGFLGLSILFIAAFDYYHYYHNRMKRHFTEFIKRVVLTYLFSFVVVGLILSLIQKAPWGVDWFLAFKRVVIVSFPASMSGAIADTIDIIK